MSNLTAKVLSVIFQPLLMPLFGTILIFNLPYFQVEFLPEKAYWFVILTNSLFTFLIPLSILLMMLRFKLIGNISMNDKEERKLPVLITGMLFTINYFILRQIHLLPSLYFSFLLAGIVSLLIALAITYRWKVSMHMTGLGGLVGAIITVAYFWNIELIPLIITLFLISGLTGSARLQLNAHTPAQVYVGFLVGLAPQFLMAFAFFGKH
jgi:hypothetical protein